MSDVRAAADFVAGFFAMAKERHTLTDLGRAALLLAEAYRGEYDDQPHDEEWLRSVGGKVDPWHDDSTSLATFRVPTIGLHSATLDFRRRDGEVHIGGTVMAKPPKTRGDVRRLCAALGIHLKESEASNV